jgi:hypothetical protein
VKSGDEEAYDVPFGFTCLLVDYGKGKDFELAHNRHGKPDMEKLMVFSATLHAILRQHEGEREKLAKRVLDVIPAALNEWKKANPWFFAFIEQMLVYERDALEDALFKRKEKEAGE